MKGIMTTELVITLSLFLYFSLNFLPMVDVSNTSDEPITEIIDVSQENSDVEDVNATSPITMAPPTAKPEMITIVPDSSHFFCSCDLTSSWCDVDCCCDPDCSERERKSFSFCLSGPRVPSKSKRCFRNTWFFRNSGEKTLRTTEENQDKLFCLVADNLKQRHFFDVPDILDSESDFQGLVPFSWTPSELSVQAVNKPTRSGDPVLIVFDKDMLQAVPWTVPGLVFSTFCETEIPITYLSNIISKCIISSARVHESCENPRLSARHFYSGFKILGTTPLGQNSFCSGNNICLVIQPTALDLPLDSILGPDGLCHNTVQRVHYRVEHFGVDGISAVYVTINTTIANISDLFLQEFQVSFEWGNQTGVVNKRSGNPGYISGLPILAEPHNRSLDLRADPLTVFGVQTDGTCAGLDQERTVVAFKRNLMIGCTLTVALPTNNSCHFLRCLTRNQLFGRHPPQNIASFGLHDSDWVRIINTGDEISSMTDSIGSCMNVPNHLDLIIAYAATHTVEDPQMQVVGVQRHIQKVPSVPLRCVPTVDKCQMYLASLPLTASVAFSKTGKTPRRKFGGPPQLGGNLPTDFFYPFLTTESFACVLWSSKVWVYFLIFLLYFLNHKMIRL